LGMDHMLSDSSENQRKNRKRSRTQDEILFDQ
jgi:hypothetical protein